MLTTVSGTKTFGRHQPEAEMSERTQRQLKFGVRFPPCAPVSDVAGAVRKAEDQGFDAAWVADSQLLWRDVYATMAVAAGQTERISLISAVTNFASRHPSVVASA